MTPNAVLRSTVALVLSVTAAHAQGALPPIPNDGQPLLIARMADLPAPLLTAMERSDCRLGETALATFPVHIFRPAAGKPPIATVTCEGDVLHGRAFLMDGATAQPMSFPVLVFAERLSETETPGFFSWDPQTKTLTALQGNDECDATVARHTYRHGGGDPLTGFSLVKVERGRLGCGFGENWQVVWKAEP